MPDTETVLYGVLGCPIRHSRSPLLMNAAFSHYGINAVYLAFEQKNTSDALAAVRALNIKGLSVTIPHKEAAAGLVDELDSTARVLGCINTVINRSGVLFGYNYDGAAAVQPISETVPDWKTRHYVILGSGGSARGIAITLSQNAPEARIHFAVRNPEKAKNLCNELSRLHRSPEIHNISGLNKNAIPDNAVIINTTPVGMFPDISSSPVADTLFSKKMVIYDIVYNPRRTKFLQDGEHAGAAVIEGRRMFFGQAALQFKLWTGLDAPVMLWSEIFPDQ